jgi:hypothetical protein
LKNDRQGSLDIIEPYGDNDAPKILPLGELSPYPYYGEASLTTPVAILITDASKILALEGFLRD